MQPSIDMTLELQGHFPHSQQKAGRRDARWWQEGNSRTVPDSSALTRRVGDSGRQRSLEKSVDDGRVADAEWVQSFPENSLALPPTNITQTER